MIKLNSHIKQQIIGFIVLILVFALTIMYNNGIFEFTFITRPDKIGSLNSAESSETSKETSEKEDIETNEVGSADAQQMQQPA